MTYTTITTEGGLLPADILDAVAAGELPGQRAADFGLDKQRRLSDELAAAWNAIRGQWQTFQFFLGRTGTDDPATSVTRERWVLPLLAVLGYDPSFRSSAALVGGRTYAISHRAYDDDDAPPVHIQGIRSSLDTRPPTGRPRLSPHALVQEYLNNTEQLWGLVTNGERLRLLRDSSRFTRPSYVEFDLRTMLEGEKFSEFALLYRLLHRSRLPTSSADAPACWLEQYHQQAIAAGGRVRDGLRDGVEVALKELGNGLLRHPANQHLRARLNGTPIDADHLPMNADQTNDQRASGASAAAAFHQSTALSLTPLDFYRQLLRLVYRLLFLMVAEERGLIAAQDAPAAATAGDEPDLAVLVQQQQRSVSPAEGLAIYHEHYSVSRLRRLAEVPGAGRGPYDDLWLGLLTSFDLLEGSDEHLPRTLGLAPLDGDLFSAAACADLTNATRLRNADLLRAIRALALYRDPESKNLRRVNYAALDVEELGSVYESLLDYRPVINGAQPSAQSTPIHADHPQIPADQPNQKDQRTSAQSAAAAGYSFNLVAGTERKTTGSYYTRPELVQELIKSALDPVIAARLKTAQSTPIHADSPPIPADQSHSKETISADRPDPRQQRAMHQPAAAALLSITVCDPACGSGHFLLAAARRIGQALAKVRSGEEQPTPGEFRRAVRDVIARCIYGVDLNPLAVDLCKLALWIEGYNAGMPLNFLDSHIRWGNSLVGATAALVDAGIPDDAYKPVSGDDKKIAGALRKRNKQERQLYEQQGAVQEALPFDAPATDRLADLAATLRGLETQPDDSVAAIRAKAARYRQARAAAEAEFIRYNLWTAAFFQPLTPENSTYIPTTRDLLEHQQRPKDVRDPKVAMATVLADQTGFFHWELEFPQVFSTQTLDSTQAVDSTQMTRMAQMPADQKQDQRQSAESAESAFHRGPPNQPSAKPGFDVVLGNPPWERIKLQEQEHFVDVPAIGKAPNKAERQKVIDAWRSGTPAQRARIAEFEQAKQRAEAESRFVRAAGRYPLTAVGDVNTYALFAELDRGLVNAGGRAGIIVPTGIATDNTTKDFFGNLVDKRTLAQLLGFENEAFIFAEVHHAFKFCALTITGKATPVQETKFAFLIRYFEQIADEQRHFVLSREDIALINPNTLTCPIFRTKADAELTKKIYRRVPVLVNERTSESPWGMRFMTMFHMSNDSGLFKNAPGEGLLPLYEAKMIWHFDHRYGTYAGATQSQLNVGTLPRLTDEQRKDPQCTTLPRYWVERAEVDTRLAGRWEREWLLGFRDVTSSVVERTAIFSLLPIVGVGNKIPLMLLENDSSLLAACFLACVNSLTFDFVTRQKLGGTTLNFFIVKQLPVLPPEAFSAADIAYIVPRVLELVYTAWDMRPFAEDVWQEADESMRRAILERWEANRRQTAPDSPPITADQHDINRTQMPQILPITADQKKDEDPRQSAASAESAFQHGPPDSPPITADQHDINRTQMPQIPPIAADQTRTQENISENQSDLRHQRAIHQFSAASAESAASAFQHESPPPFIWHEERRALIRAELDARIARLYGLTRDELRYILDPQDVYGPDFPGETFRVLKEKEIKQYGEYRTRRLVLAAWDTEEEG
jgi:hypothetical protein